MLTVAQERVGITGNYPVYPETPLQDEFLRKDLAKGAEEAKEPE